MNHLAHLFLSGRSHGSMIGSIAADFVKGRLDGLLPAEVERGIELHRAVDAFTDAHPDVAASRRRLMPAIHHHARIVVDVFYDHLLIRNWEEFSPEPAAAFIDESYAILTEALDLVPAKIAGIVERMIANDWLRRCSTMSGVGRTLDFIATRLRHPVDLRRAMPLLEGELEPLEEDFRRFFPELMTIARRWEVE